MRSLNAEHMLDEEESLFPMGHGCKNEMTCLRFLCTNVCKGSAAYASYLRLDMPAGMVNKPCFLCIVAQYTLAVVGAVGIKEADLRLYAADDVKVDYDLGTVCVCL